MPTCQQIRDNRTLLSLFSSLVILGWSVYFDQYYIAQEMFSQSRPHFQKTFRVKRSRVKYLNAKETCMEFLNLHQGSLLTLILQVPGKSDTK